MTLGRGGHGRTPGTTDSRQGKARGETYLRQASSGLKAVLLIALFLSVFLLAVVFLLEDFGLQPWGLGGLAVIVVGVALWRWRERKTRPSLDETLSDLSED